MAERCTVCNGSGKYAPMGGIHVKCIHCEGVGYISAERAQENRGRMQTYYPKANNSTITQNQVIANNMPIIPIIAPEFSPSTDSVTVTTNEIEAIKEKMLAENGKNPLPPTDKRTSAYKAWKAKRGE